MHLGRSDTQPLIYKVEFVFLLPAESKPEQWMRMAIASLAYDVQSQSGGAFDVVDDVDHGVPLTEGRVAPAEAAVSPARLLLCPHLDGSDQEQHREHFS